ncbi:glycosyltransferase [Bailinhaonella thermotolerans]|uniref:Glycosyltransferase n=1 Tax=Bailinhaonella thermotolerans TaxID=1070861 RepID=A0A3A4A6R3_9ACTN|nr:glycosyltransferase [Bailinhaonella thermotolerans]RJL23621.1 glycosyltransferase [Bailinhaonella thermotolerans]
MPREVILFGLENDAAGEEPRALHLLAQGLAVRGHRVTLAGVLPAAEPVRHVADPAYDLVTLYDRRPGRLLRDGRGRLRRARAEMARRFEAARGGHVVIASPGASDWLRHVPAPGLSRIGRCARSYRQARLDPAHLRIIRRDYPGMARSVFLTEEDARAFAAERLPNTAAIPDPLAFYPAEPAALARPRVLGVGPLTWRARFDLLIGAFAAAAGRVDEVWELHLIGEGPWEERLRALALHLGVADRVAFRGRARDLARECAEASIVAVTGEFGGPPPALPEAAAYGVPAVSFDGPGGIRSLVAHDRTGVLVPPSDEDAFAGALTRLMRDRALRLRMGSRAREHVSHLRLERVLDRWEELFEEIER